MAYWIWVFNQRAIREIDWDSLAEAISKANFDSLCEQYGIDAGMIEPVRAHFELISAEKNIAPFFLVNYRPNKQMPIAVSHWETSSEKGRIILSQTIHGVTNQQVKTRLVQAQQIFGIELQRIQIEDFGLLLAYEVARWLADQGQGTMLGLDGVWYRLNPHQAFIPVEQRNEV